MDWSTQRQLPSPAPTADVRPSSGFARVGLQTGEFASVDLVPISPRQALNQDGVTSSWGARDLWFYLVAGELRVSKHFAADNRVYLVAESRPRADIEHARLSERELAVLCRIFAGQSQKAMSYELDLSPSTVATHAGRAFGKLNLRGSPSVPLALVLVAQAACGAIALADAGISASMRQGQRYVVANLSRPPVHRLAQLTSAEREVALALVDGLTKLDIAQARCTSVHTIGRQISSVFSKLNVKGRFELIRKMGE